MRTLGLVDLVEVAAAAPSGPVLGGGRRCQEAAVHKQQPAARRAGVADGGRAAKGGERWVGTVLRGRRAAAGVAVEGCRRQSQRRRRCVITQE